MPASRDRSDAADGPHPALANEARRLEPSKGEHVGELLGAKVRGSFLASGPDECLRSFLFVAEPLSGLQNDCSPHNLETRYRIFAFRTNSCRMREFSSSKQETGLIRNVQLLRALAAIAVVFSHAMLGLQMPVSLGVFGVDIFFVISGFIISYIVSVDASQFELKRIIRIVPFYWTATLAVFLVSSFWPSLVQQRFAGWLTLATSLFFIPHDRADGSTYPILLLGWTLNYEMYFYGIVAVSMRISRQWATLIAAASILTIMTVTDVIAPKSPAEAFYGDPIVVEFLYGILIFYAFGRYSAKQETRRPSGLSFACCVVAIIAACILLPVNQYFYRNIAGYDLIRLRFLFLGVPAAVLVASAVMLERRFSIAVRSRKLLMLGDASYVIYLTHLYLIFAVLRLVFKGAYHGPQIAQWLLVFLFVLASIPVAIVVHLRFEQPVISALRRRFLHRPPPIGFVTPATREAAPGMSVV